MAHDMVRRLRSRFARILPALALCWTAVLAGPPPAAADEPTPIRVVTWNVHLDVWLKKEEKLPSFLRSHLSMEHLLKTHGRLKDFDILGLQEVCSIENGRYLAYFERILKERGPTWMYFGLSDATKPYMCNRGEAIFTRFPMVDAGWIRLPNIVGEERSAIWADLEIPSPLGGAPKRLRVYNAHMESRAGKEGVLGRHRQMLVITEHIAEWRRRNPDAPVILVGDLNTSGNLYEPWKHEASLQELQKYLTPSIRKFRITLVPAPYQLDWIFYDALELASSRVVYAPRSDHYPVSADFELR